MSRLSILVFSACLCLAWGWEPGTQYVYNYMGRSINGIYHLKQQNAIIEIQSRVVVQSQDENTIVVKLTDGRIKRHGNYELNPFLTGEANEWEINPVQRDSIEGQEDQIQNAEQWGTPFVINHKKGSFVSIKIGTNEPLWVVNYKKAIASQLQLDISGVRPDGEPVNWSLVSKEEKSATFQVFEDSITGDCSSTITVNRLPLSDVYEHEISDTPAFQTVCKDKPVYEVIKTKDFSRCKTTPVTYAGEPGEYMCSFDKAKCADFLQRHAISKYIACGEWPKLTYLSLVSNNDLLAKPFAIDTEALSNSNAIRWTLEKKESISSRFSSPPSPKEHKTLSHVFPEFEQDDDPTDSSFVQPGLEEAYLKSPIPVQKLQQTIYEALRFVAKNLKEKPDSESDNLERLAIIARALPMFSLEELRGFWQQIKKEDLLVITLFIDTVVDAGTNPTIMLLKELIENKEISEHKSLWAIVALGYNAKTPTKELLHELINLWKSSTVQSSKNMKQSLLATIADLFYATCGDSISAKRFAPQLGDLCDKKDSIVVKEFLPLLVKELESNRSPVDRIITLTAFGSFGFEEIIPILIPHIRGSGDFNDTAERTRAVLSLHRVVYAVPEKVHPILIALASNTQERPEIRMAAIGLLFTSNAPFSVWQKIAAMTWFEKSEQMVSYIHSLLHSISEYDTDLNPFKDELVEKAEHAILLVKPARYGLPYSFFDIRSSYLQEGLGIDMDTKSIRVADEHLPVFAVNRYFYQYGPFVSQPLTIFLWNYNMGEVWESIFGKLYGSMSVSGRSSERLWNVRARGNSQIVSSIWDELSVSPRPSDKRVGLIHLNLMGSINRFYDIEKLPEIIPSYLAEIMKSQSSGKPYEVSVAKYRMLAEYTIKFPTEMGLPLRFLSTLPIMFSLQGIVKGDGQNGIKSDIAAVLSWKQSAELRVELPFNGNYVATGVDVRVDSRLPKELNYNIQNGMVKVTWTPGSKVTDLLYYHVKPYTVTRNIADSYKPTLEDEKAYHIISVKDHPVHHEIPLGERYGVNVHLISHSEVDFTDFATWLHWLKKWDINIISNLAFVPLQLEHRQYHLRYKPEGTKARTVQTWFQYQTAFKSCDHTVVVQSGEDQLNKRSSPEIVSVRPIVPEFQPALERVFKNLESGNADLVRAGFTIEQKDGSYIHFNGTLARATDSWYTKDFTDLRVEKYTTTGPSTVNSNKRVDYAVCWNAVRNWNKAPHYGFSKDVLYMTDDETIGFGESCDQSKIRFKAKLFRDEYAAKHAMYSPVGQKCQKDMSKGFMYGSPDCEEARYLDQTYNNYELTAESENLPTPIAKVTNWVRSWITNKIYDFTVEHTHDTNAPNRATWTVKRDPYTGASNWTIVRPTETIVAHNVHIYEDYEPFSPLSLAFVKNFYPLQAGYSVPRKAANWTLGGTSEDKCFVGPKAVFTYDGGLYNYTVDQCEHVLMTDCTQKSDIVVLAHQEGQYKVVKVIYGNDTVELNPAGYVTINGAKTAIKSLDKDTRFEIRYWNNKAIKAVVYPIQDGIVMKINHLNVYIKVQGSHVEMTAPKSLRGRTCGLCGDFNQETHGEFKTPNRCVVSDGELMAASFKLTNSQGCSKKDDTISRRLAKETEDCKAFDMYYPTHIPEIDLTKPTKCTRYEKLVHKGTFEKTNCESVEYSAECQPGCKPYYMIEKAFTFKCSGTTNKDLVKKVLVPTSCISA